MSPQANRADADGPLSRVKWCVRSAQPCERTATIRKCGFRLAKRLFYFFAAIPDDSKGLFAKIGDYEWLLVADDAQVGEQVYQFASIKDDTIADATSLRRLAMIAFDDQNALGLEGFLQLHGVLPYSDVGGYEDPTDFRQSRKVPRW